jgi:uncharacterized integral membrane protein
MAGKIIIFIMVLLVLIFVFQNTDIVRVSFLAWEISMSRALMILLTFLIGLITGWLSGRTKRVKQEK